MSIWSSIKNLFTTNEHGLAADQQLAAELSAKAYQQQICQQQICECNEASTALKQQIADLQKQLEEAHTEITEKSDIIEQLREVAVDMRVSGKFKKADQALLEKTDALLQD